MGDINIGATITTETGQSVKSINDLNAKIKEASLAMKDAKIGTDEFKIAQDNLKKAQDELGASTKEHTSTFSQLKDQLKNTVPGFEGATSGADSLGKKLLELMANPIVLLVAAIVLGLKFLYEAFTYSVAGGKEMAQMFAGLKSVMDVIVDRVMSAGQAIIKFFSGDWKGAAAGMKEAFSGVGDAVNKAYSEVSKATAALQALAKQEREASVARAAQNAAIVKSKELLNDETASIQDRKKALKEVGDIETKVGLEDIEIAKKKLENQKIIWGQTKEGLKKHAQDIADLQIDISNKEGETTRHTIQLQRQARTLAKQEVAAAKEDKNAKLEILHELWAEEKRIADERQKLFDQAQAYIKKAEDKANADNRAYQIKKLKDAYNEEAEVVRKAGLSTTKLRTAFLKELDDLNAKYAKEDEKKKEESEKKKLEFMKLSGEKQLAWIKGETAVLKEEDKERAALDQASHDAKMQLMQLEVSGLDAFSNLIGASTAAGKAMAVASTTISTYSAAQKAYESQMSIPTPDAPVRAAIAAGVAIVSGLARVKGILSVSTPGGSGGSLPSAPTVPSAASAPLSPQNTATNISASSIQQMGNAAAPRAFVVESDIRNNQERITMLNRAARI